MSTNLAKVLVVASLLAFVAFMVAWTNNSSWAWTLVIVVLVLG